MSNPLDKARFAKALREPDEEHAERIQQHFESQNDLFSTCQKCRVVVRGTMADLMAHKCEG